MLTVNRLSCERNDHYLFQHLSFELNVGDVLQIKGSNGAGKTTLLRIIAGLISEYEGDILWQQQLIQKCYSEFRLQSVFSSHKLGLKPNLTPIENLQWRLSLANIPANAEQISAALAQVALQWHEDLPCGQLSAGQMRRVLFAELLIRKPLCWILDEPFTAIDVDGVAWLEQLINVHTEQGGMVLLTSHQPLTQSIPRLKELSLADFSPSLESVYE